MKQDVLEPGATYHIFNRGNNKENLFIEHKNYDHFLKLMLKHILPVANVYAYCLLKNHFHLLIGIKEKEELPNKYKEKPYLAFSNFFNAYTKSINKMYSRTGSLFQEHLKRKRVENESYLIKLIAYIHLNPVKHQFTPDYKKYKYSSFQSYISGKKSNLDREFIFTYINPEDFEYWHDEKKIESEELLNFLIGSE